MQLRKEDSVHPTRRNSDKSTFLFGIFKNQSTLIYFFIILVLISGMTGSWLFYRQLENYEQYRIEREFKLQANFVIRAMEEAFQKNLETLKAVNTFLEATPNADRKSFRAFVSHLLASNPDIYTIEWIPRVEGHNRISFETQAQEELGVPFSIFNFDSKGKRHEVETRIEYYPVSYAEPHGKTEMILGLDYSSDPHIRPTLDKVVRTYRRMATPVLPLARFQESELKDPYGVLIFSPLIRGEKTFPDLSSGMAPTPPEGFTAVTFHVHSLISYAMKNPSAVDVRLQLETVSIQKKRLAFSYDNSAARERVPEHMLIQKILQKTFTRDATTDVPTFFIEKKLDVAGQTWRILCTPTPEFFFAKSRWESTVAFAFGILLTLFAAAYLYMLEQRRVQEATLKLSLTDELTGIYNRRGFLWLSEKEIRHARWHKKRLILIQADLDHLKKINDVYGHAEGDAAIAEAAGILRKLFRQSDIVGRLGGDEFAALLIDVTKLTPEAVLENLKKQISLHNFNSGHPYKVRLSAGAAYFDPSHPVTLQELMNQADRELYRQKQHRPAWPS